jgi:hypothetical protein
MRPTGSEDKPRRSKLWSELLWDIPVVLVAVAVTSLPFGAEDGNFWIGLAIGGFFVSKTVFEHFWPGLKMVLLKRGAPEWCFEDGWRSNALISGTVAAMFTAFVAWSDDVADWLEGLPLIMQFAIFFGSLYAINLVGARLRKALGVG